MLKHEIDDELEILKKLVKKKQISINLISVALLILTKQRKVKQRQHPPLRRQDY